LTKPSYRAVKTDSKQRLSYYNVLQSKLINKRGVTFDEKYDKSSTYKEEPVENQRYSTPNDRLKAQNK
jgi:hypothetical protein